ncbi:MAG: helix-turn-helix domain-containing protein [Chloroflexota bacterium]
MVTLVRGLADRPDRDPYAGLVRVHATPCYDLLVSLRALFNPRTYEATRAWAVEARRRLSSAAVSRGVFFFRGHDTSLGYGVTRLVATLPDGAEPRALIDAVAAADSAALALLMVDTGETSEAALATFRDALRGTVTERALAAALHGSSASWSKTCRRVLAEPEWAQRELTLLLEEYEQAVFRDETAHVSEAIAEAGKRAHDLLAVLPTGVAIEQLAGGYTLDADLALSRITLAPSAFIHPYVATRLDEVSGEALIVFGVRSQSLERYDAAPLDPELLKALRSLGDPGRLRLIGLLSREPLTTTELQNRIGLSPATVHHHLHQLRAAGLVRQERTKGGMRYSIRRNSAIDLLAQLRRLILGSE